MCVAALQVTGRNPSDKAIEKYWSQCGGSMNFHRFCQVVQMEGKTKMTDLMKAFRKIDTNGDGFITAQEMQRKLTKVGQGHVVSLMNIAFLLFLSNR